MRRSHVSQDDPSADDADAWRAGWVYSKAARLEEAAEHAGSVVVRVVDGVVVLLAEDLGPYLDTGSSVMIAEWQ